MHLVKLMTGGLTALALATLPALGGTLDDVKARGFLKCGIDGGLPGFSAPNDKGQMVGIDADFCSGVAAAIFGDKTKVKFTTLTAKERFTALSSGEVDLLSRNTTATLTRDATLGIDFTYFNYIDGQGFLVKNSLGVKSAKELNGASVCVQAGTTTELNLADYFRVNGMTFKPIGYDTSVQTREGFDGGSCDVLTSDKSQLAAIRSELKDPAGATILPETISKEPLGPAVRQGDPQWRDIVTWTLYALITADELGVTSANVDEMKKSANPDIKRLLGVEDKMGENLGLTNSFAYDAVKQVGNYDELYQRSITPLGLKREGSVNALWTKGGLLYAPPMR
ncbi:MULTISPECIES: amino acid ABC transporter substrate-binding protein [Rhodomicrobium]|uniref:amino acid ABC transporter substrate-binding protein n=1 Tax=Rhodomicrobium TaxID=1068 RepID=UPI000B4B8F5C|nr:MULTISPECIES: amino acid ABC transporter substrate-binding protein [Rhodomicrobium]